MSYPSSQKPPIWSIDPGVIAYNCQKAGMPHPVLAMPMWEGAGLRAMDYSGHGNHGTLTNGAQWVHDGIDFDGTDDYVDCGNIPSKIDLSNPWACICWGSADDLATSYMSFFGFINFATSEGILLSVNSSLLKISTNGETPGTGSTSITTSTRYNVLLSWDGTKFACYLDGVFEYDVVPTGSDWQTANAFYIARQRTTSDDNWNGIIDNTMIFNTNPSAAQVKFISDNPWFMYQIPEELYGYTAAAPPTGNPFWYYNMLRRRN